MPKNNNKKQVKSSKQVAKTTPAEETKVEVAQDVTDAAVDNKAEEKVESKETNNKANKNKKADKKESKSAKASKNKRHWFKDFKAELKKVIWPTGKELFSNTAVVLAVVVVVSVLIFVLDLIFGELNKLEVREIEKIQNHISANSTENDVKENTTSKSENTIDNNETNATETDLTNIDSNNTDNVD